MSISLIAKNPKTFIDKTDGYWVHTKSGEKHLDIMAGGLTYTLGYGNKEIAEAVYDSLINITRCHERMGYTSDLVEEMGTFLCESGGWESYCWTVTGTSAVESAISMADRYWDIVGEGRRGILAFGLGWHGTSNLTNMMSGMAPTQGTRVHMVDTPIWRLKTEQHEKEKITLTAVLKTIDQNKDIGSIIINPAPWFYGVHIWSFDFWRKLRKICDDNEVLLILDDVSSCWGKSKALHSHDTILPPDVRSDISCVGKAITAGYAPLAATLANKKVTDVIRNSFSYGHTFQPFVSGVAAMKATTDIIKRDNLLEYSQVIEDRTNAIFQEFVDEGIGMSYNVYGLQGILYLNDSIPELKYSSRYYGRSYDERIYPNIKVCIPLIADDEYFFELRKLMYEMIN